MKTLFRVNTAMKLMKCTQPFLFKLLFILVSLNSHIYIMKTFQSNATIIFMLNHDISTLSHSSTVT